MVAKHIRIEEKTAIEIQEYMKLNELDNEAKFIRELIELGLFVKLNEGSSENIKEMLAIEANKSTLMVEPLIRMMFTKLLKNDYDTNEKMKEFNQDVIERYNEI
jgi:hypothetical protein